MRAPKLAGAILGARFGFLKWLTAEPDSEIRDTALREPDPAPSRTGRRDVMKLEGTRARRPGRFGYTVYSRALQ